MVERKEKCGENKTALIHTDQKLHAFLGEHTSICAQNKTRENKKNERRWFHNKMLSNCRLKESRFKKKNCCYLSVYGRHAEQNQFLCINPNRNYDPFSVIITVCTFFASFVCCKYFELIHNHFCISHADEMIQLFNDTFSLCFPNGFR